jgi:hypothetical protein
MAPCEVRLGSKLTGLMWVQNVELVQQDMSYDLEFCSADISGE